MTWKYFRLGEDKAVQDFIESGGIAVQESGQVIMGKPSANLYAARRGDLMNAAEEIGLETKHVHPQPRPHFGLYGQPLMMALKKCLDDEDKDFS